MTDESDNYAGKGDNDASESTQTFSADMLPEMGVKQEEEAYLIVLTGSRVGEMVKVGDHLTVGRGQEANFTIFDDFISRVHLRLQRNIEGNIEASDLQSSNGTFVNGGKIESVLLSDGDKIRIGSTTILKFSYVDDLDQSFQQELYDGAVRDALTKLHNRRYLMTHLENEFAYHQRHQTPLSLVMFDLDHFKTLNDTYGHLVGDAVLVAFAAQLKAATRTEDLAARYGGEEFVLVARGISARNAVTIADRVRHIVSVTGLLVDKPEVMFTVSAGVAGVSDPSIDEPKKLIQAADTALYAAKRAGRNSVSIYR